MVDRIFASDAAITPTLATKLYGDNGTADGPVTVQALLGLVPVPPIAPAAGTAAGTFAAGNDARIVGAAQAAGLSPVATTGSYADLLAKPTIPVLPTLATVATSGSYADLANKPTIPAAPGLATASTPGLMIPGAGLLVSNGNVSVDSVAPTALPSALVGTDLVQVVRGTGANALPYFVPFSTFQAAVGSSGSSAPSNSYPLAFTGAAGAPTGIRALTALAGSDMSSAALDGAGAMLLPTANFQIGTLQAAGPIPAAATITVSFKNGAAAPVTIGRVDAAGANGGYVVLSPTRTLFAFLAGGAVNVTVAAVAPLSGHSTAGLRMASDGTWYPQVDGADVPGISFKPTAVATGYVLIGSTEGGGQTGIAAIMVQ